jgi:hypothetical protein
MPSLTIRRVVAWVALAGAVALAACGSSSDARSAPTPSGNGAPTTVEPSLEVVLGGDSVMAGLVPAVQTALLGQAEVDYLASPTISSTSDQVAWRQGIEQLDPDLVVVLVGPWEVLQTTFAPTEPGWTERYARSVVDPLADLVTDRGARMLWIEMHSSTNPATTLSFAVLAAQERALAERNHAVEVLDSGAFVDEPGDVLADVLPGPDGTPERIRRQDGTGVHLCPAGVERLAAPVLDWIARSAEPALTIDDAWRSGGWRAPGAFEGSEQCPPAG